MHVDIAVRLPQEAETVALVRTIITNTLTLFGVADECVEDIRLALSEACTNVILYAAGDDEYEVRIEVNDKRCVVSVKNTGDGFDGAALGNTMPDARSARGRGVAIMHAVVDNVDFTSEPETGTIVRLVKSLDVRDDGPLARLRRASQSS